MNEIAQDIRRRVAERAPYVQLQNPVSQLWVKLDTRTGRIVERPRKSMFPDIPVRAFPR